MAAPQERGACPNVRVCFFHADKSRENDLAEAFLDGVRAFGDSGYKAHLTGEAQVAENADVAVMVGVKSRELYQANRRAGVHVIMMDKGYLRHRLGGLWEYWRVSVDAHHPTSRLSQIGSNSGRLATLDIKLKPWRPNDSVGYIIFAGSSEKYHRFYGLSEPTRYAKKVVRQIRWFSDREIIYRPKPSWRDAVPIDGTRFSPGKESLYNLLTGAWAMVTHGSNACFEAVTSGVPCIVLGEAVAKPISSTLISEIESPRLASDDERTNWLAALANSQWTMNEMQSGEAWRTIRPQIHG